MGLLTDVEDRIDRLVRRVFPKRADAGVQPVEIAREMVKVMERGRTLSVDAIYVPNVYRAAVHTDDFAALSPVLKTVSRDAASHVEKVAEKRGLSFTGPVRLEIVPDEGREPGTVVVTAGFEEVVGSGGTVRAQAIRGPLHRDGGSLLDGVDGSETRRYSSVLTLDAPPAGASETESEHTAWLEVTSGPEAGRSLPLQPSRAYSIGRVDEADLVLSDNRVSKRHAEICYHDGHWWLVDLDSTNGTRKNGKRVARDVLEEGDEVAVGLTTLRFLGAGERTQVGLGRA